MKLLFVFLILVIPAGIISPDFVSSSYDSRCNFWIATDAQTHPLNTFSNLPLNWQFATTPGSYQMLDVFFIDSLNGCATHTGNGGSRTTDGGFNWTAISFNDTNFSTSYNGVFFINQNTGWCVGGALQIRKTTNGGVNWFKQYGAPAAGIARSVYFFDANTGYIIGSKNFPYQPFAEKTTNGGSNWTEITPSTSGQELNEQYWFNVNTGWIAGYDILLYTTNGGMSFSNLYSNIPPTGNGHSALLSIYFTSQQTGWIGAGNLERNNIYKTTNGGTNWVFQNNPVSQAGWNQINDVRFISQDSGWAAHGTPGTGAIMFTSNGGTNWVMDNTQYSWYDCFEIYSRSKIWCGGSSGRIWYALFNEPVGIEPVLNEIPKSFKLYQNYPNPFNPSTVIKFQVPSLSGVKIIVFDVLGREVATLVNEQLKPGTYEVDFDGSIFSSGTYYYTLQTEGFAETKKMVLVK